LTRTLGTIGVLGSLAYSEGATPLTPIIIAPTPSRATKIGGFYPNHFGAEPFTPLLGCNIVFAPGAMHGTRRLATAVPGARQSRDPKAAQERLKR